MNIQTVLGPVPVDQLGKTLMHEHVFVSFPGAEFDPRYTFDRKAFVALAVSRLKDLVALGVSTFVDPCPIELGRDVRLLAEVSERSGMHIVCATGFYFEAMGIPPYWRHATVDEIADLYVREIEQGIDGTDIRAGLLKCSTGAPQISELERRCLTAASIAQRRTGVPILTHTEAGQCGPDQQDLFESQGVPLNRCLIGHSCGNPDHAYHLGIAKRGSFVGFDRIGNVRRQSDDIRAENVVKLIEAGHAERVMLSQDRYCGWRGKFFYETSEERTREIDAARATGDWPPTYTYLFDTFIPMLRARGVSQQTIDAILTDNPRRFFTT